jgi:hypothetical protein
VESLDVTVAVIKGVTKVSCCATCFAPSDWTIVDDHDSPAGSCQQICRGHSSDAGPDDTHARPDVLLEGWELERIAGGHPDRSGAAGIAWHA